MKNNPINIIKHKLPDIVVIVAEFSPFFFYLPNFLLSPSLGTFGLCLVGILLGMVYSNIWYAGLSDKKQKELLTGYLAKFSRCSFNQFHLNDFLYGSSDFESAAHSKKIVDYSIARLRDSDVTDYSKINIYVVKRGQSNLVPNQMVAFQTGTLSSSYIFVRDAPDKINSLSRFFILHELGHSSYINALRRDITHSLWMLFLLPPFLGLMNFQLGLLNAGIICIYFVLLIVIRPKYKTIIQSDTYLDELTADLFAGQFLSENDRGQLAKIMKKAGNVLMYNSSMTEKENLDRLYIFTHMIENPKNPLFKDLFYFYNNTLVQMFLPLTILVPVMGYISASRGSGGLIWGKLIAVCVFLFIALVWATHKRLKSQEKIVNIVSK